MAQGPLPPLWIGAWWNRAVLPPCFCEGGMIPLDIIAVFHRANAVDPGWLIGYAS